MNCPDCQRRICDLLDAGQPLAPEDEVAGHLAECPACREFQETWAGLDPLLAGHAARPALPANFKTTLLARLPAAPRRVTPAEIPALRARFAREHRAALASLHWGGTPGLVRRALIIAMACVATSWLAAQIIAALLDGLGAEFTLAGNAEPEPVARLAWLAGPAVLLLLGWRRARGTLWRVAMHWRDRLARLLP